MIIEAKKMYKLATIGDYNDIEQLIIESAHLGKYQVNWPHELSQTVIYDLISAGYEIHKYDIPNRSDTKHGYVVSWKNAN